MRFSLVRRTFCSELQKPSAGGGRITHAGKRVAYPLALTTASQTVSHRVALLGNAAQTLHPIAGQGFNLGLRDVISPQSYWPGRGANNRIVAHTRC